VPTFQVIPWDGKWISTRRDPRQFHYVRIKPRATTHASSNIAKYKGTICSIRDVIPARNTFLVRMESRVRAVGSNQFEVSPEDCEFLEYVFTFLVRLLRSN
jgi:hypothetical protein